MTRPPAVVRPALLTSVALGLALTGACKKSDDSGSGAGAEGSAKAEAGEAVEPDDGGEAVEPDDGGAAPVEIEEADDPRADAVVIAKAEAASSIGGKGAKSLGFSIEKISHLFALKATVKLPDWGATGTGDPKLSHDDDLDTAWTCTFGQASPCALGLALPEKAKVEVVRLYTAAGPRYRDYKGHPRVAKVRVHTDAGYVDASLADGANHTYVRFDAPIETQSLAIEVLELHDGNKDKDIQLAEVEVYGTEGVPRPPLVLDPELAWVGWETTAWGGSDRDHTVRQAFVSFARQGPATEGEDGPGRRRFARATAVFGHAQDNYALFERLHGTSCDEVEGNYMLFDKRNRMYYALGDLGGAGGHVFRHRDGDGFAVGWMDDAGQFTVTGIIEEGGKLVRKRPRQNSGEDGKAQLSKWGFDPQPLPRGIPQGGAVAGCHPAGTGELEPVIGAAKLDADANLDPAQWMICSVGAETLYASAPCNAKARAYLLDGAGKIVGERESKKDDARGLRLRRTGDRLFVELSAEGGDTATLLLATPGALVELEKAGALFVRPPASCTPCEDDWQNPEGGDLPDGELGEDMGDPDADEDEDEENFADEGNDESLPGEGEAEPEEEAEPEDEPEE